MNEKDKLMPSSLDREVSTPDKDAFGHRHFAHALRSLIEDETHMPPFSIGLLGGWGTGKSTIKELYRRELSEDQSKKNGHTRSKSVHTITFNAWRFGGEDIKRALLRHVFLELGGDDENLKDKLFRQISETQQRKKSLREYTSETLRVWAMPLLPLVFSLLVLLVLFALIAWLLQIEDDLARAIIGAALTLAYSYLLKQIKSPPISPYSPITKIETPSTTAEEYEDFLLSQLTEYKKGKSGKLCERLVVFIDDLDRLSAEEMVQGLDAIRTFMEIPRQSIPEGIGLIFVISCDEDKVADALYRGRGQDGRPGSVFTRADARRYLDRIFQFRLEIPPFPRRDMRQYALEKLKELPGVESDLKTKNVALESLVDRVIHVDVQNPRNALQIVNAFAQAWWLARKRETEELSSGRPGGLHEGAVTDHPIALGALCALKVNYPDFYGDLQEEPELIHRFTDVVIRRTPLKEQPRSTQELLSSQYLLRQDNDSGNPVEVKPEYRPLRQFLASLIGLRWPDSLQPLLLLSEDPITRKFGSKAQRIYAAFVSGDTQGVLEGFAHESDAAPLRQDEARLLYEMAEDLRRESHTRRVNASRVLADLVDRLPKDNAHFFVGPLCRELGDSPELRWQMGIPKISQILSIAEPADRTTVASRLVDEVLTIDADISFRLETLEPPNLDEAVEFARETVTLALSVRKDHSLETGSDSRLLSWLEGRTVRVGEDKQHQLPFPELEQWISDHESHLLPALGQRYTALLASQLETDEPSEFDVSASIKRADKVFTLLWDAGEESRPTLWQQLSRYVALQQQDAVHSAWRNFEIHKTAPDSSMISAFVQAFAGRLEKEATDDEWGLELGPAVGALISILQSRALDLSEEALSALSDLSITWSAYEKTASHSCSILDEMQRGSSEEVQRVFDDLIPRLLTDLPDHCIQYLAGQFPFFDDSKQSSVESQLQTVIANDDISEFVSDRYRAFIGSVPVKGWKSKALRSHLDQLLPQIANHHNNHNEYLFRIFPPISHVLEYANRGSLGTMLYTLFSQAKNSPQHYAWLHSCMVGKWPEPSDELNPYNPEQIFEEAQQFTVSRPESSSKGLLASMSDMLERDIVPRDKLKHLFEAISATWSKEPTEAIDSLSWATDALGKYGLRLTEVPNKLTELIDGIDWTNNDHPPLLEAAWRMLIPGQETSDIIDATNLILAKGPIGPENEPDQALKIWIDTQGVRCRELLVDTITQKESEDLHRKRLWAQAVRIERELGPDFFIDVVPQVLALPSIEETASAILEDADQISDIIGSTDGRARVSQKLIDSFPLASTKTIKSGIASWSKKLSGQAFLSRLKPEDLTDDDMAILEAQFPGSAVLKKLKRAMDLSTEKI